MPKTASTARLRAARLESHGLRGGLPSIADAVERLGCVQAQDLGAAKWVVGARVPGSTEADVDRAIDIDRTVIRSWPIRGTLHLLPTSLLRPILSLTAARQLQRAAGRHRELEIDDRVHGQARDVALRELTGERAATRDELQAAWEAAGIATAGQRGYHLIWRLALEGVLCGGPVESRSRQRFVLLDEWAPAAGAASPGPDETLGTLFRIYARGHGPVSVRDFAWWSGLTLSHAKTALAAAGDSVIPFDDERFISADAPAARTRSVHAVLAPFDEYYLGYGDRSALCEPEFAGRIVPGSNGLFHPILVADGEVVGTWRRAPERRGETAVEVAGFRASPPLQAFRPAFEAWAAFWGTTLGALTTA